MPRSCLSPAPLFCPHSNPVQLQVLPSSPFVLCSLHSLLGTWTHLLTCCLAAMQHPAPRRHFYCSARCRWPNFPQCMCAACLCGFLCVCVVSCVLHLTTFEFKLYKIYDGRAFSHQQREGSFPRVLTEGSFFRGCPVWRPRTATGLLPLALPAVNWGAKRRNEGGANIVCNCLACF